MSSSSKGSSSPSPPWELLLLLISQHLDPKTLAISSCVCKSWSISISSDHLWKPLFLSHYPSSLHLLHPTISYLRLFSLLHTASKRRFRAPSLSHLLFTIDVFRDNSPLLSPSKPGDDKGQNGVFQFDVGVEDGGVVIKRGERPKVTWTVVMKGWRGVFLMMDGRGNRKLVGGSEDGLRRRFLCLGVVGWG